MKVLWLLARVYLDIALHRRGPEQLPPSAQLLSLTVIAYVAIHVIGAAMVDAGGEGLVFAAMQTAVFLGIVWALLFFVGKPARFQPAVTALLGTAALLSAMALPLVIWDAQLDAPAEQATAPRLLYVALWLWSLDVGAFILSRALNKPYVVGVFIMVVYELASWAMRDSLMASAAV